jgi:hypothetical protein
MIHKRKGIKKTQRIIVEEKTKYKIARCKSKAVPLHATVAFGARGSIAPTHS